MLGAATSQSPNARGCLTQLQTGGHSSLRSCQKEPKLPSCLQVCEDCPAQLQAEVPGLAEKPVQVLMPRLLSLFKASSVGLRVQAVTIVNLLAEAVSQAIGAYLDQ